MYQCSSHCTPDSKRIPENRYTKTTATLRLLSMLPFLPHLFSDEPGIVRRNNKVLAPPFCVCVCVCVLQFFQVSFSRNNMVLAAPDCGETSNDWIDAQTVCQGQHFPFRSKFSLKLLAFLCFNFSNFNFLLFLSCMIFGKSQGL